MIQRNENNTNTTITQFQQFIELKLLCIKAPFSALKSWKRMILAIQFYHLQLVMFPNLKHWLLTVEHSVRKGDSPPDVS